MHPSLSALVILVVEDEALVMLETAASLKDRGCEVLELHNEAGSFACRTRWKDGPDPQARWHVAPGLARPYIASE